ncbi:Uncharacterised protein [Vibrio cholerae]|nr:Uncharacterised protein [Vibrio cholerae]CSH82897.1 Uncharacterised protein [Vibrio cholerae]
MPTARLPDKAKSTTALLFSTAISAEVKVLER